MKHFCKKKKYFPFQLVNTKNKNLINFLNCNVRNMRLKQKKVHLQQNRGKGFNKKPKEIFECPNLFIPGVKVSFNVTNLPTQKTKDVVSVHSNLNISVILWFLLRKAEKTDQIIDPIK